MRSWLFLLLAAAASLVAATAASVSAAGSPGIALTPVGRLPFPERGFVVDLPARASSSGLRASVTENGRRISGVSLTPVASSGVTYGVVLAIDSSDSMRGAPEAAALQAARAFVGRRNGNELVGVVTFNGSVSVRRAPSASSTALAQTLQGSPKLAYGTHIYDAVLRSLALLEGAHVSTGSVVLLSDGADVGSRATLAGVRARAAADHARVFTVGLHSRVYNPGALERLAAGTGGSYAEAGSVSQLAPIFDALSGRLAKEYLVEYRSPARPGDRVRVAVAIDGVGSATTSYITPIASGLAPFHRSPLTRFLLSGASLGFLALLVAGLVAVALSLLLRGRNETLVGRIGMFVGREQGEPVAKRVTRPTRPRRAPTVPTSALGRWRAKLASEFEIGEISISADVFIFGTLALTVLVFIVLLLIAVPLCLLAILVPVFARAWVSKKVGAVRSAFEQQLPETLQVLASALRSGHSFFGALNIVVESCPQPTRREFRQVLTDDQLGVPIYEALRNVAVRMESRDMQQIALLGELQRTAGGNSAEVLDTVVETIRERTDVRRLARTLTAQGRMGRWIISSLPVLVAGFMWMVQPALIRPFFESGVGQGALVVTGLMAVAGSFWVKKIVEIEV